MEWGGWRGSGRQCFDSEPTCVSLGVLLAGAAALVTGGPRRRSVSDRLKTECGWECPSKACVHGRGANDTAPETGLWLSSIQASSRRGHTQPAGQELCSADEGQDRGGEARRWRAEVTGSGTKRTRLPTWAVAELYRGEEGREE